MSGCRPRAGVCQDLVHLSLILLRERGIAARYVSGYLFAAPENGGEDSVEVDTHAWVEALLPDAGALRRRGADPGCLQGHRRHRGTRRQREDDTAGVRSFTK